MKDKRKFKERRLTSAFKYAFQGIIYAIKEERNFKIHLIFTILVICVSFIVNITKLEWLFIIIAIFGVLALELINSAIERAVDLATKEIHPLAKQAKDLAAAAVLVYALMAVIIGIMILGPKIIHML